jgi:Asp-tRNA(Asn)/Glu-tRNA(Gln) amidotransferase C subunit
MENVFRFEDEVSPLDTSAKNAFPETEDGYAKVPKVFEGRN